MESDMKVLKDIETKRGDLIDKLNKIEEKKSFVSPEVYEKVKKEYEKKLQEIETQLFENIELVKTESKKIKQEIVDLGAREKDLKLRMEEIELRYTIGEYDDEAYNSQNGEAKEKLNAISSQLKKLTERSKWLENFMAVKDLEAEVKPEPPKAAAKEEKGIKIDEHVLEEKLPGEEHKLDELLVEDLAMTEISETHEKKPTEPVKAKKEEVVPCPKCGHKNAPDSWYCEKCGAEILDISSK
jgi:DNA repair exonuclease SbcCD ATPase subunit